MAGKIEVTVNKNNNQVILTQNTTNVVEVHTLGPQGAVGATGATGPQHDPNSITGSLHLTGSLIVSSSYVDFTNATAISGSTFSGSFVGDGSGITGVTAEWDGSHNGNAEITGSLTTTSYINATHYYLSNVSNVLYGTPTNKLIIGDETTQWPIIDIGRLGTNSQQIRIYGQITASGNISSSATVSGLTGSFGRLEGLSTITAVGNISSSAYIYGTHLYFNNKIALYEGALGLYMADNTTDWPSIIIGRSGTNSQNIQMHGQITASGTITAVGNISSSGIIYGTELRINNKGETIEEPVEGVLRIGGHADNWTTINIGRVGTTSQNIGLAGPVTASTHISSSGGIYGNELHSDGKIMTRGSTTINNNGTTTYFGITSNKTEIDGTNISLNGPVTASGNISASGDSNYLGGSLTLTSTANSIFTIIDGDGDEQHVLKGRGNVNSYLAMGAASNLGIGTSTPSQKLTVTGNISSSATIYGNTGSFNDIISTGKITTTGNISSSGNIYGNTGSFNDIISTGNISSSGTITTYKLITSVFQSPEIQSLTDIRYTADTDGNEAGQHIFYERATTLLTLDETGASFTNHITASGNISSSANIYASAFVGGGSGITGVVSSSYAVTASYALNSSGGVPAGTVSSSAQIIYGSISSIPSGIYSSSLQTLSNITASGNISSSGTITANAFVGDGSGLTNVVSSVPSGTLSSSAQIATEISGAFTAVSGGFSTRVTTLEAAGGGGGSGIFIQTGSKYTTTNDLEITGSLRVGSGTTTTPLTVEGSGSTVFEVIGSVGSIFSIDDSLSGSLLAVSDISGIPQLEVFSDGKITLGAVPTSLYTTAQIASTTATTQSVYSISTSSYDAAFFDYVVTSASNMRAGNIMSVWDASSNLNYTETTTTDIGDTSNIQLLVNISASRAHLHTVCSSASWKIKTIIKSI